MKYIKYLTGLLVIVIAVFSCEQEIEPNSGATDSVVDPAKTPSGVVTGDVLANKGNAATIMVTVGGDNGSTIKDVGVILMKTADAGESFAATDSAVVFGSSTTPIIGENQANAAELAISTDYYYRAYALNGNGISYGEVKQFTTLPVYYTPYKTDFSEKPGMRNYWYLDGLTGYGETDAVWWFNPADAGAPAAWGQSIAAVNEGEPQTIHSPQIVVAEKDELTFSFYIGLFGAGEAKIKVYITEDLESLGDPVKDWTLASGGNTKIEMDAYAGKMIYVVMVVEQGNVFFYNFSIAPPTS